MNHTQVYEQYKEHVLNYAINTKEYFPNGKNSIRVRQNNGQEFVFTFMSSKSWKFETLDQFLIGMKGEKKHG